MSSASSLRVEGQEMLADLNWALVKGASWGVAFYPGSGVSFCLVSRVWGTAAYESEGWAAMPAAPLRQRTSFLLEIAEVT